VDQEVHATAGREASATGSRPIGNIHEHEGFCSLRLRIAGNLFSSSRGGGEREGQKRKEQKLKAVVHSRIMAKKQEVASAARLAAEGGIVSGESTVAEPEIEGSEGSAEERVSEPDESAEAKGDRAEAGCSVKMGLRTHTRRCGRPLHVALDGGR